MLQNKLSFNQSSVSLEIIGLPDYSKSEKKDQISIISQWKLMIINKPLIEGNIDHLISVMEAFYIYSNLIINDHIASFESQLIDINAVNYYTHNILLKSSKPNVKPLNIKIGNSVLSDIINCFDQFNSSEKVRKVNSNFIHEIPKKDNFKLNIKHNTFNLFLPPIISLCSLLFVSTFFIYFNNEVDIKENNAFINSKKILYSDKSINTIL